MSGRPSSLFLPRLLAAFPAPPAAADVGRTNGVFLRMRGRPSERATISRGMGQRVTVLEKPSGRPGIVRFEINRILTGMGHERYRAGQVIEGNRPPDVLARRLFDRGGIDAVHINSNIITVDLDRGADTHGIVDIIGDLYTYYMPGVEVPDPASFSAPAG